MKFPACLFNKVFKGHLSSYLSRGQRLKSYLMALAVLLASLAASLAATGPTTNHVSQPFVKDDVIVVFKPGVAEQDQDAVEQQHGDQAARKLKGINARLIKVHGNRSVENAIQEYQKDERVLYAEPNYIVHAMEQIPDDGYFQGYLWGLKNTGQTIQGTTGTPGADIKATFAWDTGTGSPNIVVGVVDTGIDYTHADLAGNVWVNPGNLGIGAAGSHGYSAITGTDDPMDDHGHGTHVSGTIGAKGNNATGVVGVNWTTSIMGLKFLSASGNGTIADAITAIDYAVAAKRDHGVNVRVLNNSWGGGGYSQALLSEINVAGDNDILFVVAAGNSGSDNDLYPTYPASYNTANMIVVAATDNRDLLASFSNYGANSVHLGAPGVDVVSTWPGDSYAYASGTSMATPHVTGAAALILGRGYLPFDGLKSEILTHVDKIPSLNGKTTTGGRLNVFQAIQTVNPTPDFSIAITPSSRAVKSGGGTDGTATYTITVTALNGFSGTVSLSASGWPTDATGSLSSTSIVGSGISTLSITSGASTGTYTITVTGTSGSLARTATAFLVVANNTSSATFVKSDTTTQGNWLANYGKDGYDIVHYMIAPNYATVTPRGCSVHTWASPTSDPRGLQTPDGTSRFASCYYSFGSFTLDVNVTDYNPHRVSLYCVDWDPTQARQQTIAIFDRITGVFLADYSMPVDSFTGGQYITWDIVGPVVIRITYNGDPTKSNAVLSGIFFDPVVTLPPPPAVPTGLNAASANGQVTLRWVGSDGATGYNVKRSGSSGGPYTTIATVTTTETEYVDSTVAAGMSYYYVVAAVNDGGESADSNEAGATLAPAAPTGLKATPGNAQVTLTWTASAGATSYDVLRSTTSGDEYMQVGTTASPDYTDNSVDNGTTYYYVVSAVNSGGTSPNSVEVSATPTSPPPPDFTISAVPGSRNVTRGKSTTYTVTVGASGGFSGSVSLSVSGLPAFSSAGFNPTSVTGSGTSTMTVSTTSGTPRGIKTLTITGTNGSLSHSKTVTLRVN